MSIANPPDRPTHKTAPLSRGSDPGAESSAMEKWIDERIEVARAALWRAELTRQCLGIAIAALAGVLAWIVVDHWIWSPPIAGRVLVLAAGVTALAVAVVRNVLPVLRGRVRADYAARAIERDHPELGHALSSYVSIRQTSRASGGTTAGVSAGLADRVLQSVGAVAASRLKTFDESPSEATGLLRWWLTTVALVAVFAIYALASPKNSLQSAARLLAPLANVEPPRRVRIENVRPVNVEVLAGRPVDVTASIRGLKTNEPVTLRWVDEAGAEAGAPMSPADDSPLADFAGRLDVPPTASGRRAYEILAGDGVAGPFAVTIRDTPVVNLHEIVYDPPGYTGEPTRTQRSGAIRGLDGTRVTVRAMANRPVARAMIEFNPKPIGESIRATAGTTEMTIAADGRSLEWSFPLRYRSGDGGAVPLSGYRIVVADESGQSNGEPIIYPIEVVPDLAPEVTIVTPRESPKEMPIDAVQLFEIHAADIDHGLARLELEMRRGLDVVAVATLWQDDAGERGNQIAEYRFRPSRMIIAGAAGRRGNGGLIVGDEIEFVAVATDNRSVPSDPLIVPNVTRSTPVRIRLTAPEATPETGAAEEGSSNSKGDQPGGQSGSGEDGEAGGQSGGGGKGEAGQSKSGGAGEGESGSGKTPPDGPKEGGNSSGKGSDQDSGEGSDEGSREGESGEASSGESAGETGDEDANTGRQPGQATGEQGNGDPNAGEMNDGGEPGSGDSTPAGANDESRPQDDAEAFERIKKFLDEQEKSNGSGEQGSGEVGSGEKGAGETGDGAKGDGTSDGQGSSDDASRPASTPEAGRGEADSNSGAASETDRGKQESSDGASAEGSTEGLPGKLESSDDASPEDGRGELGKQGDKSEGVGSKPSGDGQSGEREEDVSQPESAGMSDDRPPSPRPEADRGEPESKPGGSAEAGQGEPKSPESGGESASEAGSGEPEAGDMPSAEPEGGEPESGDEPSSDAGRGGQEGSSQGDGAPDEAGREGPEGSPEGSSPQTRNAPPGTPGGPSSDRDSQGSPEGSSPEGGSGSGGASGGEGEEGDVPLPEPPDLEYTKKATDMVLDYLDQSRESPDPELLERLKWTPEDLQRFRQRWQSARPIGESPADDSPLSPDIEEALRSLGMRPPGDANVQGRSEADNLRGIQDAGNRRIAPPAVRDAFEAFQRGLHRSGK